MSENLQKLLDFRANKGWEQLHKTRNQVAYIGEEVTEIRDAEENLKSNTGSQVEVFSEIGDAYILIMYLANDLNFNLDQKDSGFDDSLISFGRQLSNINKKLQRIFIFKLDFDIPPEELVKVADLINEMSSLIISYLNYMGVDFDTMINAAIEKFIKQYDDERFTGNAMKSDKV